MSVLSSVGKGLAFGPSAVQEFLSLSKNTIKNPGNMRSWVHSSMQIDELENKVKREKERWYLRALDRNKNKVPKKSS